MQVISFPNPILKTKSEDIDPKTYPNFKEIISEMIELMRAENGVGLAAIQVGKPLNFFVYDDSEDGDNPRVLVNPQITATTKECEIAEEGCLSFPETYFEVERPAGVRVRGLDENGKEVEIEAVGFLARIFQHEIDHLRGVVILDRATPEIKREVLRSFASR